MANSCLSATVRSPTRVRLVFSEAQAGGAFSALLYSLVDLSLGSGSGPAVKAAIAVAGATNNVELVLATPLAGNHAYGVVCSSVPGVDATTFSGTLAFSFTVPSAPTINAEPQRNASDDWAFGRDLVHTGRDYLEDASGDLVVVSGLPNVMGAIFRRILSYGLPWDQTFGPRLDDYVDGPNAQAAPASGVIKAQVLADDRVSSVKVTFETDSTPSGGAFFRIAPTLQTDAKVKPFNVALSQLTSAGGGS